MTPNFSPASDALARPYPCQIREIQSQLYDLCLLLTTLQASRGSGQRSLARVEELKQVIATFLDSIYAAELVTGLGQLHQAHQFHQLQQLLDASPPSPENQRLADQTSQLDAILSTLPNIVFLQDRSGRISYVNTVITSLLGVQRQQVWGKTLAELGERWEFSDAFRGKLVRANRVAWEKGQITDCEVVLGANSTTYHYACVFHPMPNIDALLGIVTQIVVLSEPEPAWATVDAAAELIQSLSSAAFWVDAGNYGILDANQAAAQLCSCDRSALLTANLAMLDLLLVNRLRTALQYLQPAKPVRFRHALHQQDMAEKLVEVTCCRMAKDFLLVTLNRL